MNFSAGTQQTLVQEKVFSKLIVHFKYFIAFNLLNRRHERRGRRLHDTGIRAHVCLNERDARILFVQSSALKYLSERLCWPLQDSPLLPVSFI